MWNKLGIDIKDQAEPTLERNEIVNNDFQMVLEKNGKKKWDTYKTNNTVIGPNDFP